VVSLSNQAFSGVPFVSGRPEGLHYIETKNSAVPFVSGRPEGLHYTSTTPELKTL
jgi:hypothetical protein